MWSVLFNDDLLRMNIAINTAGNRNTKKLPAESAVSLHAYVNSTGANTDFSVSIISTDNDSVRASWPLFNNHSTKTKTDKSFYCREYIYNIHQLDTKNNISFAYTCRVRVKALIYMLVNL